MIDYSLHAIPLQWVDHGQLTIGHADMTSDGVLSMFCMLKGPRAFLQRTHSNEDSHSLVSL